MLSFPIYMDSHATTPTDPRVLEAMLPYFTDRFGNAASRNHRFGWEAEEAVERGRKQVADLIGASAKDVIFTSGATESDNLAVKGVALANRSKLNHVITVTTEHKAVLDSCKHLQHDGFDVTFLSVRRDGRIDLDELEDAVTSRTALISVMMANNEIGVIQPMVEIGAIARRHDVLFHSDAVQAAGKVPCDVDAFGIDLMSITAHKMYGPKGVGALYVRRRHPRIELDALLDGGGHERGMRSGTLNVPGIVGLGKACDVCRQDMAEESERLQRLRDRLNCGLHDRIEGLHVNGSMEHRLPHNLNVSVEHVAGESLMMGISDVAVSSGSACSSANRQPSHVLKGIGLSDDLADASIRFGLSRFTTDEEVDYVIDKFPQVVKRLRELSPLFEI